MSPLTSERRSWRSRWGADEGVERRASDAVAAPRVSQVPAAPAAVLDPVRLAALEDSGLLANPPVEGFDRITRLTTKALGVPVAVISIVGAEGQTLLSADGLPGSLAATRDAPVAHGFCQHVVERAAPLVMDDARNVALLQGDPALTELEAVAYAGMPLTTDAGHTLGALCAIDLVPRDWSERDLELLADLAAAVMGEVARLGLARRLELEVRRDPVTGLGNRLAWEDLAPREVARAHRHNQPLVLALLELDRSRRARITDPLLRDVSRTWAEALRDIDVLVRLGAEEFALLMPATGLDPAFDVVERLRHSLWGGATCSAGVAMLRGAEQADDLLDRASVALLRARRSGRSASLLAS